MVTKLLCQTCTPGSDDRKRAQHQWPTVLGHGYHMVAVSQQWLGWSGQYVDKRATPLLLPPTRSHSLSLSRCAQLEQN